MRARCGSKKFTGSVRLEQRMPITPQAQSIESLASVRLPTRGGVALEGSKSRGEEGSPPSEEVTLSKKEETRPSEGTTPGSEGNFPAYSGAASLQAPLPPL